MINIGPQTNRHCNINTEETTTLKNEVKLLKLENKLLKDDITNKQ